MTYEEKYNKLVSAIYKDYEYAQSKINSKDTHSDFALIQGGRILALNCLIFEIKKMENKKR